MAKKGAHSSGGGSGRDKQKNQEMARHLPPSPKTWNSKPWEWPYHRNLGTKHEKKG